MGGGTGTTDERTLGRKVLDGAKYVGKHFWKVLPVGSLINFLPKIHSSEEEAGEALKLIGHIAYFVFPFVMGIGYLIGKGETDSWTLKGQKEFYRNQEEHTEKINSSYDKLFENAANFEDSLRIYQENNLEKYVEFNEPSFKDKERIVKSLEKSVAE